MGYLAMNLLWQVILLPLCILLKCLNYPLFGYIFLVYPGTLNQVKGYMPQWYRKFIPIISVIGIISKCREGERGLVVATPWTVAEMTEGNRLEVIARHVKRLTKTVGAKSIALAGRMPSIFTQKGYRSLLSLPIVTGDKGTVYTLAFFIKQITETVGINVSKITIGILGYGFIGSRVVNFLLRSGTDRIIVVDPRIKQEHNKRDRVLLSRYPTKLANCDLVIILTSTGEQVEGVINHLKHGVVILDDTYPQLPRRLSNLIQKKGGKVIKAVLNLDDVVFWPRLPNWEANWLPGCVVEGLVSANKGFANSQQEFNQFAQEMNFKALNVSIKHEL